MKEIHKGDVLYWARIIPNSGLYDVYELKIRTVEDTYFVGIEKREKHAYLFGNEKLDDVIFFNRNDALNKVKNAEKNKIEISDEVFYEEY